MRWVASIVVAVALVAGEARAASEVIYLRQQVAGGVRLYVAAGVKVSVLNRESVTFYDIVIERDDSAREMVSIEELPPAQSVDLEFGKAGLYRLMYSDTRGKVANKSLLIEVVNWKAA